MFSLFCSVQDIQKKRSFTKLFTCCTFSSPQAHSTTLPIVTPSPSKVSSIYPRQVSACAWRSPFPSNRYAFSGTAGPALSCYRPGVERGVARLGQTMRSKSSMSLATVHVPNANQASLQNTAAAFDNAGVASSSNAQRMKNCAPPPPSTYLESNPLHRSTLNVSKTTMSVITNSPQQDTSLSTTQHMQHMQPTSPNSKAPPIQNYCQPISSNSHALYRSCVAEVDNKAILFPHPFDQRNSSDFALMTVGCPLRLDRADIHQLIGTVMIFVDKHAKKIQVSHLRDTAGEAVIFLDQHDVINWALIVEYYVEKMCKTTLSLERHIPQAHHSHVTLGRNNFLLIYPLDFSLLVQGHRKIVIKHKDLAAFTTFMSNYPAFFQIQPIMPVFPVTPELCTC